MYVLTKQSAHSPPVSELVRNIVNVMLSSQVNNLPCIELAISLNDLRVTISGELLHHRRAAPGLLLLYRCAQISML